MYSNDSSGFLVHTIHYLVSFVSHTTAMTLLIDYKYNNNDIERELEALIMLVFTLLLVSQIFTIVSASIDIVYYRCSTRINDESLSSL